MNEEWTATILSFIIIFTLSFIISFAITSVHLSQILTRGFEDKYFKSSAISVIPHQESRCFGNVAVGQYHIVQYAFKNDKWARKDMTQFLRMQDKEEKIIDSFPFYVVVINNLDDFNFEQNTIPRNEVPSAMGDAINMKHYNENYIYITWSNTTEMNMANKYITPSELEMAKGQTPRIITRWLKPTDSKKSVSFT